jgi:hypothetical protein
MPNEGQVLRGEPWGVFRDGRLVSSEHGESEKEALEQAEACNKFNGNRAHYVPMRMRDRKDR